MARSYLDEAIVLHRRPHGEADRVVTLLTKEHGKQTVIARGVRKPQARNAAGLDLFAHSNVELMPGRGFTVLIRAQNLDEVWPTADLERTACLSVLCEAVGAATSEGLEAPEVFDLALTAKEQMRDPANPPEATLLAALLQLGEVVGYKPELDDCYLCNHPVNDNAQWFVPSQGSVIHGQCRTLETRAMRCVPGAIPLLRSVASGVPAKPGDETVTYDGIRLLTSHLAYQLDHRFHSVVLLSELAKDQPVAVSI